MRDGDHNLAHTSAHTPGPWSWFGNAKNHEIYLATEHSGRRYVMGFERWGMRGAQPRFQPTGRGLVSASDLVKFEVGDQSVRGVKAAKANESVYRLDIRAIDCADARLIAYAPDHALVARAMTIGIARWDRGELCFGGIRYSTNLDEFGVPILYDHLRERLSAALDRAPDGRE